jgi:hypothetical protein
LRQISRNDDDIRLEPPHTAPQRFDERAIDSSEVQI